MDLPPWSWGSKDLGSSVGISSSIILIGIGLIYLWVRVRWLDSDVLDNKILIDSLMPVRPRRNQVSDAPRVDEVILRNLAIPK